MPSTPYPSLELPGVVAQRLRLRLLRLGAGYEDDHVAWRDDTPACSPRDTGQGFYRWTGGSAACQWMGDRPSMARRYVRQVEKLHRPKLSAETKQRLEDLGFDVGGAALQTLLQLLPTLIGRK